MLSGRPVGPVMQHTSRCPAAGREQGVRGHAPGGITHDGQNVGVPPVSIVDRRLDKTCYTLRTLCSIRSSRHRTNPV